MKYKVGDTVCIKSMFDIGTIIDSKGKVGNLPFKIAMNCYCSSRLTIKEVDDVNKTYKMKEDPWHLYNDEMIEGLVEEEIDLIPKFGEYSDNEPLDIPTMTTEFVKEHGLPCPEGYQFVDENGNVINTTKIVLEKKKKEYPKTIEECKDKTVAGSGYKTASLLIQLERLLICRDAYWKIAGEEMGLGKPWKPNWEREGWYVIVNHRGDIVTDVQWHANAILAFPTEEKRDAFYENFKELIEDCKELL